MTVDAADAVRVAICVNPMSGRDVRRLAARATNMTHEAKRDIVARIAAGAQAAGATDLYVAREPFRIAAAALEHMGLDAAYIDGYGDAILTADSEAVAAVIAEVYTASDQLVFVLLGDAELIRDDIAKYGPVTELAITEPRFRP